MGGWGGGGACGVSRKCNGAISSAGYQQQQEHCPLVDGLVIKIPAT